MFIVRPLLIEARKSPLLFFLESLSSSNSMVSTGDRGFKTFRNTQTRFSSSLGMSNSSLRVPDRLISIAWEHALFHQLAFQVNFHIARTFELFEDDVVHTAAGVNQGRRYDGQAPTLFNVSSRTKETLRALQRV
jgi:hypothetical protein